MVTDRPYLIISDLQIPFEAPRALEFCVYIKRHYGIPDTNVINVGDEVDNLHGGLYPKDPDGHHTPNSEIGAAKEKIHQWGDAFPYMMLCESNHGIRWMKKASAAEIPSQMMRAYQDVLQTPPGWHWRKEWRFPTLKHPFRVIHGCGYSGMNGHRTAAMDGGISTAIGHLHSHPGIARIVTSGQKIWGMNTGCLIDVDAYAFKYNSNSRFKPGLGVGVVFNQGSMPMWIPYE